MKLHTRMLLGFLLGAGAGLAAHAWAGESAGLAKFIQYVSGPVGQVFLRLLFMLVIPLIFSALVLGVAELGDVRSLGRVGAKTLAATVLLSTIAVVLGLLLVNLLQPGAGLSEELRGRLLEGAAERAAGLGKGTAPAADFSQFFLQIIPDNPLRAAANGDMLAVMFFSLMVGVGLTLVSTAASVRFQEAIQGLYDVTMRLIGLVIQMAPIGVAALLFTLTAQLGVEILVQLVRYVGVVVLALAIHLLVVYSLAVWALARRRPLPFFRAISEAMLTAFSTASSNATLPTSLKVAEEKLRLPPQVARFVLTVGATANQNGTALFEGVTVLFLAQFYGVPLTLAQQAAVMAISIAGGIGTAGVPAGSIPVVAMILGTVGIPVEGIGLILGVDRLLDMCRTTLNVTGDLVIAAAVSHDESDATVAHLQATG